MAQRMLSVSTSEQTLKLFGSFDCHAKMLEDVFAVNIRNRETDDGNAILIDGDEAAVDAAYRALAYLKDVAEMSDTLDEQSVRYVIHMVRDGHADELEKLDGSICITGRGKPIKAKTVGQKKYVEAIEKNTITLGIGPAGTGKTFLAVAMAVKALREKRISRILLTRPAIEAGEKLGFLPGDLQSKIDPYLRPLYDALYEMIGTEAYARFVEKGTIEIAPLAYMRGRTLDDSFIILDEAQNATPEQMKMFLTRLGFNSKMVVTGDLTQTDLPSGQKSGLAAAVKILEDIDDIAIHRFSDRDVVRHKLVQKIILAYEKHEREGLRRAEEEKEKRKLRYAVSKEGKNGK